MATNTDLAFKRVRAMTKADGSLVARGKEITAPTLLEASDLASGEPPGGDSLWSVG